MSDPMLEESPARIRRRGRLLVVAALIVSLIATSVTQYVVRDARESATRGNAPIDTSPQNNLASLNSYTLALLLGGLRGPLVMMLWTSSETQKTEHDLEDLDTKIELIRLLQPEFASVHIFQIWNKAYNISVQMTSLFNKYTTILDAIDYGNNALRASPNDINLLVAVADVYFNKLGTSTEKGYYRARVRAETLPHKVRVRDRSDPGWRRLSLDPMLDASGNLLPEMTQATRPRPAALREGEPFNNGAPMQYLESFQPFPYGISPIAIAYQYYMAAQTLQRSIHVKHAQLSSEVIDSRPAVSLEFWAQEDQEIGRRNELAAFGIPTPVEIERMAVELPAARLPLNAKPVDLAKLQEAIFDYHRGSEICTRAIASYLDHVKTFSIDFIKFQSHTDEIAAMHFLDLADEAYLKAVISTGEERQAAMKTAIDNYSAAIIQFERLMLKFYTDDGILARVLPGVTKERIDSLSPAVVNSAAITIQSAMNQGVPDSHSSDREDFMTYFTRIATRMQLLGNAGAIPSTQATTQP